MLTFGTNAKRRKGSGRGGLNMHLSGRREACRRMARAGSGLWRCRGEGGGVQGAARGKVGPGRLTRHKGSVGRKKEGGAGRKLDFAGASYRRKCFSHCLAIKKRQRDAARTNRTKSGRRKSGHEGTLRFSGRIFE